MRFVYSFHYFLLSSLSYYMCFQNLLFQASCEIKNEDQSVQSCFQFNVNNSKSWLYIERDHNPPRCFLEIAELERENNGTYSCFFDDALSLNRRQELVKHNKHNRNAEDHHRIPLSLIEDHHRIPPSSIKHFTLTVLVWPSGILVNISKQPFIIKPFAPITHQHL